MGQLKPMTIILLVVGFLLLTGKISLDKFGLGGTGTGGTTPTNINVCSSATTPQVDFQGVNTYIRNTTISPSYVLWIENGDGTMQQSSDTSSPLDVSVDKKYKIYATATNYYGMLMEGTAGCEETINKQGNFHRTGNFTQQPTFFNTDDSANTQQAISANDEKTVKVKISQRGDVTFNNPACEKDIVVCFDYTTAQIDDVDVVGGSEISVPTFLVGLAESCSTLPNTADGLSDLEEYTYRVKIDSGTTDPIANITVSYEDWDFYRKEGSAEVTCGLEDDANVDIGLTGDTNSTLWLV